MTEHKSAKKVKQQANPDYGSNRKKLVEESLRKLYDLDAQAAEIRDQKKEITAELKGVDISVTEFKVMYKYYKLSRTDRGAAEEKVGELAGCFRMGGFGTQLEMFQETKEESPAQEAA